MSRTRLHHVKTRAARCSHDKEEVFIFIGSNADKNTIYAGNREHVPSKVTFFASSPCTLFFEEGTKVFARDKFSLALGSKTLTPTGQGKTFYAINDRPHSGPKIVVP